MSTLLIINLIVGGLMVLTYFSKLEAGGIKGAILLFLSFWFIAQILPSGCVGNPPIFQVQ